MINHSPKKKLLVPSRSPFKTWLGKSVGLVLSEYLLYKLILNVYSTITDKNQPEIISLVTICQ